MTISGAIPAFKYEYGMLRLPVTHAVYQWQAYGLLSDLLLKVAKVVILPFLFLAEGFLSLVLSPFYNAGAFVYNKLIGEMREYRWTKESWHNFILRVGLNYQYGAAGLGISEQLESISFGSHCCPSPFHIFTINHIKNGLWLLSKKVVSMIALPFDVVSFFAGTPLYNIYALGYNLLIQKRRAAQWRSESLENLKKDIYPQLQTLPLCNTEKAKKAVNMIVSIAMVIFLAYAFRPGSK
jgi:hypothetical protein